MQPLYRRLLAVTAAGASVAAVALPARADDPTPAPTGPAPTVTTLASGYLGPYGFTVRGANVTVADGFAGTITRVGVDKPLVSLPGKEIAAVEYDKAGKHRAFVMGDEKTHTTRLVVQGGGESWSVNLSAYEKQRNPDGRRQYGIARPSSCVKAAWKKVKDVPLRYKGVVESHPYAVASLGSNWVVADAAGNDLLVVDAKRRVRTLAVLPAQPVKITKDMRTFLGLPACAEGVTYAFEPVPTDVELGPDGLLYVSTLPGGPDTPAGPPPGFGGRGSVYTVHPRTGRVTKIATGFTGSTGLAVDATGTVYVAELGAGRISTVDKRRPAPYVTLPSALAVEVGGTSVYATTLTGFGEKGPLGDGKVVKVD